ncbi:methanol metabolism-related c-type cytochrome [Rhodovulum kholense]|uniref:Methanol metabolism-related c-type cytochrome n=3 Tax=Paracoccaceae TaxID=31989 RepID=A0A8E3APA4_9RHOB|nr:MULTISPECIES: c-type cytochrome, methanol metabolism-related [Rhodovulum]PTW42397.1 methanol metabolism-related c-type cytochrome [Rhodovulum kholense]RAP39955.1 c-type cytochrome, methanol metabolism-related [Rhodovulum viride]
MTKMKRLLLAGLVTGIASAGAATDNAAQEARGDSAAVTEENGRYFTADGIPTYKVAADGTVDWMTYSGFRRYHSECHVCHGPDGMGSTYAPPLKDAVEQMDYYDFVYTVSNGRENVDVSHQKVMPSFGHNKNVMCYLDDIYVYLKARGDGAIPRGRPAKKEAKSDVIAEDVNACMG